jgi:membrane protein implicated in regulation of membrane protease activity
LLCALLSLLHMSSIIQLFCFILATTAIFLMLKKYTYTIMRRAGIRTNCDRYIGKKVIVYEPITAQKMGAIKIYGDIWPATSNEIIAVGEQVEVISYSGNHFIVKKVSPNL